MKTEFVIAVKFNGRYYRYPVKLVSTTEREETYHVLTKSRTLVFRNNRPFFRNRGLKHRRPNWVVDENLTFITFSEEIIRQIEANIGL